MSNSFNLENFDNNGVAFPFELENNYSSETMLNEYFAFKDKAQKIFGTKISLKPHLLSTFFDKIARDPEIIKGVKKIIGDNVYIWSSSFFPKAPGEGKIVSYHQDNPYWQLTTNKVVSAWVALTESNVKCGTLEVAPKTH